MEERRVDRDSWMMCLQSMRRNREPILQVVLAGRVLWLVEPSVLVALVSALGVGRSMNKDAYRVGMVIIIPVAAVWLGYYQERAALVQLVLLALVLVTEGTRERRH